jgi:hypothetical protein
VHGDLRVVGARLDAQVAAGVIGLQVVAEERRQRGEQGGPTIGESVAVGAVGGREQVGPNPNVIVSPFAARPSASPVSSGGASGDPPTAPLADTSRPWVIRAAA